MTNLKQIKKALKKDKTWKEYKKIFHNKQMRLSVSYVALLFDHEFELDKLVEMEKLFLEHNIDEFMFVEPLSFIWGKSYNHVDWESFSKFMWYQYQTSTYWKDIKKNKKNIFTEKNYIELNAMKREVWQKWINSLDGKNSSFNSIITKVLWKVT